MNSYRTLAVATLVAILIVSQMQPGTAGETQHPFSWTGPHIGGHGGLILNNSGVTQMPTNANAQFYFYSNLIVPNPIGSGRSAMFGAQLGYNYQMDRVVVGFEADGSYTNITGANANEFPYALSTSVGTTADRDLDKFATLRVRVGVTPFERTLLYATGGLALGHASLSNTFTIYDVTHTQLCGAATGLCAAGITNKWLTGWVLGGGIEQAIAHNWTIKIEGLHYNLGTLTNKYDDPTAPLGNYASFSSSADFKGSILRFGLNYRFD
jgi:outer membrane immunogenic protein